MRTDLSWLRDTQPRPDLDRAQASAPAARTALLDHIESAGATVGADLASSSAPRRRRRIAPLFAGAAAAAATAGIVLGGTGGGSGPVKVLGLSSAEAAPMIRLADKLSKAPAPTGDATLVVHHNALADGHSFSGEDLLTDSGVYYYGATRAELEGAAPQPGGADGSVGAEVRAATDANDLAPDAARQRMIDATLAPVDPNAPKPDPAVLAQEEAARAAIREKLNLSAPPSPLPQREIDDNRVWIGALDALELAGGRPDVRAGVLRLVGTIPGVDVEQGTDDGHAVLRLRNTEFSNDYAETITIDATTGLPLEFVGGTVGKSQPDVVVTYEVSRVTAADLTGARDGAGQ